MPTAKNRSERRARHSADIEEVRSLREHAQRCRNLAQATMDLKAKTAALEMAEEYDAQAMRLLGLPDNCRSVG
jgi:hypothetical protein